MSLSLLPSLLLLPPVNLLLAACVGAMFRRRRAGRAALAAGLGGLVFFSLPIVSGTLICGLETGLSLSLPAGDLPGAIVILSADDTRILVAGRETTTVGRLTLERERAGAALARRTGLPVLVTGGVIESDEPSLAAIMADSMAGDFGIAPKWREDASKDTWENAVFSARILRGEGIRAVYVVTHAWHMRRALLAFRAAGMVATPAPVALDDPPGLDPAHFIPRVSAWMQSFYAVHEWIGLVWYGWRARS